MTRDLPVVTYAEIGDREELIAEVLRRARADQRDRETGLYLIPDNSKSLKQLKELLRGKRVLPTVEPRSS